MKVLAEKLIFSLFLFFVLAFLLIDAAHASTRKSTAALSGTNPSLDYRGPTVASQISYLDRLQKNYEKELAKWYKEKAKIEEKLAKEKQKREAEQLKLALKEQKSFNSHKKEDSSVARNPLNWFKKKIAGMDDDSASKESVGKRPRIEFGNSSRGQLSNDEDLALSIDKPKKKDGFWKRILQALGIA